MAKQPQAPNNEHEPDEFVFGRHAVEAALKAGTASCLSRPI